MLETVDVIMLTAWALAFGAGWLLLARARVRGDRRPPIVGVQRKGRVEFLRRDLLVTAERDERWTAPASRSPRAAIVTLAALLLLGVLRLSL